MNQFRPVTMIASTIPGTHNPRISAQIVTNRLLEICERPPIYNVGFISGVYFLAYTALFRLGGLGQCHA